MFKTIGTVAAFAVLTSATWFGLTGTASAWMAGHQETAYCDTNNRISFDWSFTNQEPNEDKYTFDLVVTEVHTNQTAEETVAPGETVSGTFKTDFTKVSSYRIKYEVTWTDGRVGYHQFGDFQPGLECEQPPKQIEVCRDGKVITINEDERKNTDTDAPCPVVEPKQIEVCRDGKVITINEDERKNTDTDAPCPVVEPNMVTVCRDGEVMTINEDERKSTDTDAPCPEVLGEQKELPNTGAAASLMTVFGSTTLLSAAYGFVQSRKS